MRRTRSHRAGDRRAGRPERVAVALERQPPQGGVEEMGGDVLDGPADADRRSAPVLGVEAAEQLEQRGFQLGEEVGDEDRFERVSLGSRCYDTRRGTMKPLAVLAAAALLTAVTCSPARKASAPPSPDLSRSSVPRSHCAGRRNGHSANARGGSRARSRRRGSRSPRRTAASPVDFATQIRPLLESRCRPCHFPGGKMYERLPFDRPETLRLLGEKVFTRIKEEDQQALIRAFLAQSADG